MSLGDKFSILLIENHFWYKTMSKEVMLCRLGISSVFSDLRKEEFLALGNCEEDCAYAIIFYCQDINVEKSILFQGKLGPSRNLWLAASCYLISLVLTS